MYELIRVRAIRFDFSCPGFESQYDLLFLLFCFFPYLTLPSRLKLLLRLSTLFSNRPTSTLHEHDWTSSSPNIVRYMSLRNAQINTRFGDL